MAAEKGDPLQETFLSHVLKNRVPLTVFLVNGVKLQGTVTRFDNFSLLLTRDVSSQLVYKHTTSTIVPVGSIQLYEADEEERPAHPAPRKPIVEIRRR